MSGPYCINQLPRTLVTMVVHSECYTLTSICLIHLFSPTSILFGHSGLALLFMATIFLNQDSLTYCLLILSFSVTVAFNINQFLCYQLQSLPTRTCYLFDALLLQQKPGLASNSKLPIDVNGWHAGIANIKYSQSLCV